MVTDRRERWAAFGAACLALLLLAGCGQAAARRRGQKTVQEALACADGTRALALFAAVAGDPGAHAPAILERLRRVAPREELSPDERRLLYLAAMVRAPELAPQVVRLCGGETPRLKRAGDPDPRYFALTAFVAFGGLQLPGDPPGEVKARLQWLERQTPEPRHAPRPEYVVAGTEELGDEAAAMQTASLVKRLSLAPPLPMAGAAADELVGRSDTPAHLPALYALAATATADDPRHWVEGDLQLAILRAEKLAAAARRP